ncbi:hypothetical protein ACFLZ8_03615 [Planctomycetota bacterium]
MTDNVKHKLDALAARIIKVRRWLIAIALLKVIAYCLLFASAYIGIYAWLDHRFNFGGAGRIIAFILLITGILLLVYKLSRLLLLQFSLSNAANFIEDKNSFDQQLVAAMEYYENKTDYPYSQALADQLVCRIFQQSESFAFDSVIDKWRGYALAMAVLLGTSIVGFHIQHNLAYFKTYLARLTKPSAVIVPVPLTNLYSVTGNMVATPESILTFTAGIRGHIPDTAEFVLVSMESDANDVQQNRQQEQIQINPDPVEGTLYPEQKAQEKLEISKYFAQKGKYQYRFESGQVFSNWHNIDIRNAPEIESITAEVSLPFNIINNSDLKNYTDQIKDNKLELIENSIVKLKIKTTSLLGEAVITDLNGRANTKQLDGVDSFTYDFTNNARGTIGFSLVDEKGLKNENIPELQIILKTDKPPEFTLITPESDYLATNVASIPIEFEVSDDFGLSSIRMVLEVARMEPEELTIPVESGTKEYKFSHTLELEQYDLEIGDSVLFYAQAEDIISGIIAEHNRSGSEMYFIEIRPYRQIWRLSSGSGQSSAGGSVPPDLLTLLEYTRAIIKKTSTIASKNNITQEDNLKLESIAEDVDYCDDLMVILRDDPDNEFTDAHKAVLNEILRYYESAGTFLQSHDALAALVPEKEAYRILRKFIQELEIEWQEPSSGQSSPPEEPDSVKLTESPEFTGLEKERIQEQLQELQDEVEQLNQQQKKLKTEFENFLEQKAKSNNQIRVNTEQQNQESTIESSSDAQSESSESESSDAQSESSQSQSSSGEGQESSQQSESSQSQGSSEQGQSSSEQSEASDSQGSSGQGQGSSAQSESSQSQGSSGQGQGSSEQSESLESQSSSEQGQTNSEQSESSESQVSSEQGQTSSEQSEASDSQSGSGQGQGSSEQSEASDSKSSLGQRQDQQEAFSAILEQKANSASEEQKLSMFQAKQRKLQSDAQTIKEKFKNIPLESDESAEKASSEVTKHLDEAIEKMGDIQNSLHEARYEPESESRNIFDAAELMELVEDELELADNVLNLATTDNEKKQLAQDTQELAERLAQDAASLDESLTEVEKQQMLERLEKAKRILEQNPTIQLSTVGKSQGSSGSMPVLTRDLSKAAETFREISRQMWTITLDADKQSEKRIEDEPSDVRFYEDENEFFENAAQYNIGTE